MALEQIPLSVIKVMAKRWLTPLVKLQASCLETNHYIWRSVHGTNELSSAMKRQASILMVTRLHKQRQLGTVLFTVWYANRDFAS